MLPTWDSTRPFQFELKFSASIVSAFSYLGKHISLGYVYLDNLQYYIKKYRKAMDNLDNQHMYDMQGPCMIERPNPNLHREITCTV